jgi:hypothetical protein
MNGGRATGMTAAGEEPEDAVKGMAAPRVATRGAAILDRH